jgi:hypothetical protein
MGLALYFSAKEDNIIFKEVLINILNTGNWKCNNFELFLLILIVSQKKGTSVL